MLLTISGLLSPDQSAQIRKSCAQLPWKDGSRTAGKVARAVKKNLQADLSGEAGRHLSDQMQKAIETHPVFKAAVQPKRLSNLLISRTEAGGGYGMHIDNALMARGGEKLRTDISFTLFLSEPDSYEGGELVIEHPGFSQALKPAAGDLVLYPSTSLHEVRPVTSGQRLVCVGWAESRVRDAAQREILFDLENISASLRASDTADAMTRLTLSKSISNLLRLWAET